MGGRHGRGDAPPRNAPIRSCLQAQLKVVAATFEEYVKRTKIPVVSGFAGGTLNQFTRRCTRVASHHLRVPLGRNLIGQTGCTESCFPPKFCGPGRSGAGPPGAVLPATRDGVARVVGQRLTPTKDAAKLVGARRWDLGPAERSRADGRGEGGCCIEEGRLVESHPGGNPGANGWFL